VHEAEVLAGRERMRALRRDLALRRHARVPDRVRPADVAEREDVCEVVGAAGLLVDLDDLTGAHHAQVGAVLICLGVGLAAGVGRWDMAVILTLFVLLALSLLEYFEQFQVFRSMQMSVATRDVDTTNIALKRLFINHGFDFELLELNRPDEDEPMGKIVYLVNLDPIVRTSKLSEELMSADAQNIDGVEWKQKESTTYIYK